MNTVLIENGIIVTLGEKNKVLKNHCLLIEDGVIKKILPENEVKSLIEKENIKIDQVINAKGKVVLPGFINTHMHFYSSFARGLTKAVPAKNFQGVLENLWWRLDKKLNLDDSRLSAMTACIESIKHGTTTIIDHHASPNFVRGSLNEVAKATTDAGLRACLCYEISDRDGKKIADDGIEENREFVEQCQKTKTDFLKGLIGLHASFTIGDETLRKAAELGRKLNCGFHIHCAEAESDQTETQRMFSKRVVQRLKDFGILGSNTICAHGVHLSDDELALIRATDTMIVHNPQSNMNNAVGVANIFAMLNKGILVGLGTDAMTTNMLEELRSGLWIHKLNQHDASVGFVECTQLLTQNNRKIAERFWGSGIGELREGAYADVILLDYFPSTEMTVENFLGHLVFGLSQAQVDTTIVAGKVLMQNKVLCNLDEESIMAESRELSKKLWDRF